MYRAIGRLHAGESYRVAAPLVLGHTVCDTNSCAFKQYELRHFMAGWWNVPTCNHLAVTFRIMSLSDMPHGTDRPYPIRILAFLR